MILFLKFYKLKMIDFIDWIILKQIRKLIHFNKKNLIEEICQKSISI